MMMIRVIKLKATMMAQVLTSLSVFQMAQAPEIEILV
jgi:hypothetical protein